MKKKINCAAEEKYVTGTNWHYTCGLSLSGPPPCIQSSCFKILNDRAIVVGVAARIRRERGLQSSSLK